MLFLNVCITHWLKTQASLPASKAYCCQPIYYARLVPPCGWRLTSLQAFYGSASPKPSRQPTPDASGTLYDCGQDPEAIVVRASTAAIRHSGERRNNGDLSVWHIGCWRLGDATFPLVVLYHSRALKQLKHASFTFPEEGYATLRYKLADQDD